MQIAVLLIIQGAIMGIIGGREDFIFSRASRQLARFQEELEEITDALLGAQEGARAQAKQKHVGSK